jgi:hypothetical protein
MSIISCSIELSKVPKNYFKKIDDGRVYLNFDVVDKKEADQYGYTHSISLTQSKEDRRNNLPKTYIGNGKQIVFNKT